MTNAPLFEPKKLRPFAPQVEFVIEDMFLDNRPVSYKNLRPEPGLGMDKDPVTQNNPGPDNGIVLDTAEFTDMSVIIHDTARYGAVCTDNHAVVQGRGEDLGIVPDNTLLANTGIGSDKDIIADDCAGADSHGADNLRVLPEGD